MNEGTIPESAIYVVGGILILIIITGIVLGVVIQLGTLRSKAKADAKIERDIAVEEATKETKSQLAFEALKDSVDKMNVTVDKLSKGVGDQLSSIVKDQQELCRRVDIAEQSSRSAHKRLDEHRRVEHQMLMFRNNNHFSPEDLAVQEENEN